MAKQKKPKLKKRFIFDIPAVEEKWLRIVAARSGIKGGISGYIRDYVRKEIARERERESCYGANLQPK